MKEPWEEIRDAIDRLNETMKLIERHLDSLQMSKALQKGAERWINMK